MAALKGAARLDEQGPDPEPPQPCAHRAGHELGAVVGAEVFRRAVAHEQLGQDLEDLLRAEPPPDPDRQALAAELVDHHQHPEHLAVTRPVRDEVVRPHVPGPLRAEPDA